MIITKNNITIADVKTFKTKPEVRVEIDLGEIPGEKFGNLFDLKRKGYQQAGVIIGDAKDITQLLEMWRLYQENIKPSSFLGNYGDSNISDDGDYDANME